MNSTRQKLLSTIRECVDVYGFHGERDNLFVRQRPTGIINRITVPIDAPETRAVISCTVNLMLAFGDTSRGIQSGPRLSANIGSITRGNGWRFWNIPWFDGGQEVLLEITSRIQDDAVPWFDSFQSADDIRSAIKSEKFVSRRARVQRFIDAASKKKWAPHQPNAQHVPTCGSSSRPLTDGQPAIWCDDGSQFISSVVR